MNDEQEVRLAWEQHVGRSPEADRWLQSVVARHREPHRHYHTLRHVCWVLRHVATLAGRGLAGDVGAIVAAACFHDAIYDPAADDNELASAKLAAQALGEIGWPPTRTGAVAAMIEATAGHAPSADRDTAVLLAADLAVLAADPVAYGDYVRGVRREYAHVDEAAWRQGRARVLRAFLDRDHIYDPALGLGAWERRARANLTAELVSLGG